MGKSLIVVPLGRKALREVNITLLLRSLDLTNFVFGPLRVQFRHSSYPEALNIGTSSVYGATQHKGHSPQTWLTTRCGARCVHCCDSLRYVKLVHGDTMRSSRHAQATVPAEVEARRQKAEYLRYCRINPRKTSEFYFFDQKKTII